MFSDERVIAAAADFVPAADETWRLQNGDDAECRLFQAMAGAGHYGKGGGTRQGLYLVAPSGRLLASANTLSADAALELLARGLQAWHALPEDARWLADEALAQPAHRWEWSWPADGLVLEQFSRDLPADLDPAAAPLPPVQRDHAWFSRTEARGFLPADPVAGAEEDVAEALVARLSRFHFVDAVKGQVQPFAPQEVAGSLRSRVVARDGDLVDLVLEGGASGVAKGPWLMGDNAWSWPGEHPRSVNVRLAGRARYDLAAGRFTRFELLALGTRRGSSGLNGRKGPQDEGPLGFWLQLAGDRPADRVAPAFVDVYDADWIARPGG